MNIYLLGCSIAFVLLGCIYYKTNSENRVDNLEAAVVYIVGTACSWLCVGVILLAVIAEFLNKGRE